MSPTRTPAAILADWQDLKHAAAAVVGLDPHTCDMRDLIRALRTLADTTEAERAHVRAQRAERGPQ